MNAKIWKITLSLPLLGGMLLLLAVFSPIVTPRTLAMPASGRLIRISVAPDGTQGNGDSSRPAISADGRYVAFSSLASNLVDDDTNGYADVFVYDMHTGLITLVSVASDGTQGNKNSWGPSISADGRYVAFNSFASNLVDGDTNNHSDVFIHDMQTGKTTLVSIMPDGTRPPYWSDYASVSADGRYVAFLNDYCCGPGGSTSQLVFVRDVQAGQTITAAMGTSRIIPPPPPPYSEYYLSEIETAHLSADGRYVAFETDANYVAPTVSDTNNVYDVYVRNWQTGAADIASAASDGTVGNNDSWDGEAISADGRYVAFLSRATNLVPGDTNDSYDVFVRDMQTGLTTRVSVASDGTQANGYSGFYGIDISADGRYVVFPSTATGLTNDSGVDIYIHDMQTGETARIFTGPQQDGAPGNSDWPSISADGRYVAFESKSTNLVDGDTNNAQDIFVCDREGGWLYQVYLPLVLR